MSEEQNDEIIEVKEPERVYVHGNDLHFNTTAFCFMRPYHLPNLPDQELPLKDTWFIVPAIQNGPMLTLISQNIMMMAIMVIDQNGRTVKAHRVNTMTAPLLTQHELDEIRKEAIDIPKWEQLNQQAFPYESMFDKTSMTQRVKASGTDFAKDARMESENIVYNQIRQRVKPQPCTTCGKRR